MTMPTIDAATLRALLADAEKREAVEAEETPHTRLQADLRDHRVNGGHIADALARIWEGFALLGVDLLAEGGPAKVAPVVAQVDAVDSTAKGGK